MARGGKFIGGERPSLADIVWCPVLDVLDRADWWTHVCLISSNAALYFMRVFI